MSRRPAVADAVMKFRRLSGSLGRGYGWGLIILAFLAHAYVILTIARQPLNVNASPLPNRSVIWALHHDTVRRVGPGADFFAVYHAALALRSGMNPYVRREKPRVTPYFYRFRYLPVTAQVIGRPLARFSPRTAYLIWIVVLEITLAFTCIALVRATRKVWLRYLIVFVLLFSSPYFLEVHMGQFTFITLALFVVAILLHETSSGNPARGRRKLGGAIAYASSVLIKVFPLAALPAFARHRRYWPSVALATLVLILTSVPFFITHTSEWWTFIQVNFVPSKRGMHSGNHGLLYLVYLAARDLELELIRENWSAFVSLSRLVVLTASSILVLLTRCDRVIVGAATMILAHFLSYTHVWEHHSSGIVIVGLLLIWFIATDEKRNRRLGLVLSVLAVIILALPTPFALFATELNRSGLDPSQAPPSYAPYLMVSCKVVPMVVLFLVSVAILCRAGFRAWPTRAPVLYQEAEGGATEHERSL